MGFTLTAERPECAPAIEAVLNRAFGPGRHAKTSERVRERGAAAEPALSRVALDDAGAAVGVCRIWRVAASLATPPAPLYFLGPLAVDPEVQAVGLGLSLTREVVAACRAAGGAGIVLVGAERFFRPLGFTLVPAGRLALPGPFDPNRLLWLELKPGGLDKAAGEIGAPPR